MPRPAAGDDDPAARRRVGDDEADARRRLEQRLDRAAEAAQRLLSDAVWEPDDAGAGGASDSRPGHPPPAGWQQPRQTDSTGDRDGWLSGHELELLLRMLASVRDRIPAELQHRLADAVREVLLALRALIDWYLERIERRARRPAEVEDIPIL